MRSVDQELKQEVENALGQQFEWSEIQEGVNDIYSLVSNGEEYVLKVHTHKHHSSVSYREDQKARFRAESKLYQLLADIEPVVSPKIVYEDFTEENHEHGFYVMEKMEGGNLEDVVENLSNDQLKQVIYQYGQILGRIHKELRFPNYGLLLSRESGLETLESFGNWRNSVANMLNNLGSLIDDRWDEKPETYVSQAEEKIDIVPEDPEAVLLHSDNRLENVLIEEDDITAFLDWSFCRSGHAMYDVVRAEYLLIDYDLDYLDSELKDELREKLLAGYRSENELSEHYLGELRQLYRYMTVLGIVAGFPKWSSDWDKERRIKFEEELKQRLSREI